ERGRHDDGGAGPGAAADSGAERRGGKDPRLAGRRGWGTVPALRSAPVLHWREGEGRSTGRLSGREVKNLSYPGTVENAVAAVRRRMHKEVLVLTHGFGVPDENAITTTELNQE